MYCNEIQIQNIKKLGPGIESIESIDVVFQQLNTILELIV